jgi:hypothetical protein
MCARCCTTIPHPLLVAGSLLFHGSTVRRLLPWIERLTYLARLPKSLLIPPKKSVPASASDDLVQIASTKE